MLLNDTNLKILTPNGFEPFSGVVCNGIRNTVKITFTDNSHIITTPDHRLFRHGQEIQAKNLLPKMIIDGQQLKQVVSVKMWKPTLVYDILDTLSNTFYYNKVLSHNCEFISEDPLLFDTIVLASLTEYVKRLKPYATVQDIILHEPIKPNSSYILGMDPATGTGSDYTTITAFSFPELNQVLSWRSNVMTSPRAYQVLKKILNLFVKQNATVYFSIENNGVGEGILTAYELDESPPDAHLISEEGAKRVGVTTNGKTKMKACVTAKDLVERGVMTIKSIILLEEMKSYIRKGNSYSARSGASDDFVSALLICIRVLEQVASYDQGAFDKMYAHAYEDSGYGMVEEYDDKYEPDSFVF